MSDPSWVAPLAVYAATLFVLPMPPWTIGGTLAGLSVLIALWIVAARLDGMALVPLIVLAAGIGMALAPGGGAWSLFFACGAIIAGRLRRREIAVMVMAALGWALCAYRLLLSLSLLEWGPGLLFGATGGMSAMYRRELERKKDTLAKRILRSGTWRRSQSASGSRATSTTFSPDDDASGDQGRSCQAADRPR